MSEYARIPGLFVIAQYPEIIVRMAHATGKTPPCRFHEPVVSPYSALKSGIIVSTESACRSDTPGT